MKEGSYSPNWLGRSSQHGETWMDSVPFTTTHTSSCCSVTQSCLILCCPMDCSSWSLLKLMSTELVMPPNYLILCHPLLHSIFPRIRVFSNELALQVAKVLELQHQFFQRIFRVISFRIDWFDLLLSKGLSRVFSNTTVQKHQYFSTQPSLWSNSHIHTWLLEKPQLWLDRPLLAK